MIYNSYDNVGLVKVLSFLKTHNKEYLSGQDLSDVLKISRVAIWKHIKKIQDLGYKIESKQKLGYKLVENTKMLLPWEITNGLQTKKIGKRAYFFDSIDSTQNFALKISEEPKENGTVVIAHKQTLGKGREGRKWISPQGGIWTSIIIHPKFDVDALTILPLAVSVAIAYAIEKEFNQKPSLKWPNDVMLNNKKVAGILTDVSMESNKIHNVVIGIGVNFDVDAKKIEKSIKGTPNAYGITSLTKSNSPVKFFQTLLYELENIFEELNKKNSKIILDAWKKRSATIGKNVQINGSKKIRGKAIRIDDDGALVIKKGIKIERILAGDAIHLR